MLMPADEDCLDAMARDDPEYYAALEAANLGNGATQKKLKALFAARRRTAAAAERLAVPEPPRQQLAVPEPPPPPPSTEAVPPPPANRFDDIMDSPTGPPPPPSPSMRVSPNTANFIAEQAAITAVRVFTPVIERCTDSAVARGTRAAARGAPGAAW